MTRSPAQFGKRAKPRRRSGGAIEWLEARVLLTGTGNLAFDDEFNQAVGTQPNTSVWSAYLPTDPNNGAVNYTNTTATLSVVNDPSATDGRALAMTIIPQKNGTFDSSEISTQVDPIGDSLEYGEVSARIKMPSTTNAAGIWPAFWMLGNNISTPENQNTTQWPEAGEIDIVENKGSTPGQAQGSLHAGSQTGSPDYNPTGVYNLPGAQDLSSAYHIYSINWTPTTISFAVDGNVYESQNITTAGGLPSDDVGRFQHPFFVILDVNEGGAFAGGNNGTQYTVTAPTTMYVDYVRVSGYQLSSSPYTMPASPSLADADISGPTLGGTSNFDGISWIQSGSGSGITGTTDQFNYDSQTFTGNVTIVAELTTLTSTSSAAQAGIMIRNGTANNASFAFNYINPDLNSATTDLFTYRNGAGTVAQTDNAATGAIPQWLMLVRSGNTFTAYDSTNGTTWTQNGTSQTITMGSSINIGLAISSDTNSALNTAFFQHVSILSGAWTDTDIGSPNSPGSASYNSGTQTWTVGGGGADIFGTADQFNLASQTLTGDGSITAEVDSIGNTNTWAKAGVMLRNDTTAGSAYVNVDVSDLNGITFQWRSTANSNVVSADTVTVAGLSAPYWVQLTRLGNVFSAYYSANGSSWTQIGTSQTIVMNTTVQAGLAVTAHDNATLSQATFSNVNVVSNLIQESGANLNVSFDASADPITVTGNGSNLVFNVAGGTYSYTGVAGVTVNFTPNAGDSIDLGGDIAPDIAFTGSGPTDSVTIGGAVTFAAGTDGSGIQNITLGSLTVSSGQLLSLAPSDTNSDRTVLNVQNLSIGGALDLTNNQLNVIYGTGTDPISTIQSYLSSGYASGAWDGPGIISSTVAAQNSAAGAPKYDIGYADGADTLTAVPSGQIEILPTIGGDAELLGSVGFADFQIVLSNFGQPGSWDQGNFTYGSTVNFADFQLVLSNFGANSSALQSQANNSTAGNNENLPAVNSAEPPTSPSDPAGEILDGTYSAHSGVILSLT